MANGIILNVNKTAPFCVKSFRFYFSHSSNNWDKVIAVFNLNFAKDVSP